MRRLIPLQKRIYDSVFVGCFPADTDDTGNVFSFLPVPVLASGPEITGYTTNVYLLLHNSNNFGTHDKNGLLTLIFVNTIERFMVSFLSKNHCNSEKKGGGFNFEQTTSFRII
jgi:hypothetical protein